jgi:hypothetical protein
MSGPVKTVTSYSNDDRRTDSVISLLHRGKFQGTGFFSVVPDIPYGRLYQPGQNADHVHLV